MVVLMVHGTEQDISHVPMEEGFSALSLYSNQTRETVRCTMCEHHPCVSQLCSFL